MLVRNFCQPRTGGTRREKQSKYVWCLHVYLPDVKISIALGVVHDLHLEREELVKCLQGIKAFVEGEYTTGSDDKSASSIYTRSKKIRLTRLTKRVKCRGATETCPPLMNQQGLDYSYRVLFLNASQSLHNMLCIDTRPSRFYCARNVVFARVFSLWHLLLLHPRTRPISPSHASTNAVKWSCREMPRNTSSQAAR